MYSQLLICLLLFNFLLIFFLWKLISIQKFMFKEKPGMLQAKKKKKGNLIEPTTFYLSWPEKAISPVL